MKKPGPARYLFAGLLLLGLALRLAVIVQPLSFQLRHGPLTDDSFYSLQIARNLALGRGFTFDGIHETNGFQPLFVFLMVPVYRLIPQDRITPLYLAMLLCGLANLAAGYLLYRTARRRCGESAGLFALSLFCFSPYMIYVGLNGLESSLCALLWMLCLELYLARVAGSGGRLRDRALLGLALAVAGLARADSALLAAALALDYLFRPPPSAAPFPLRLRHLLQIGVLALLLYAPWLGFNYFHFKTWLPQSGPAVRAMSLLYGDSELPMAVGQVSADHVPLAFYTGHLIQAASVLGTEGVFFPVSPLLFLLKVGGQAAGFPYLRAWPIIFTITLAGLVLARWFERKTDVLFFAIGLLVLAYSFFVFGAWFFFRYLYPAQFCLILISASLFHHLGKKIASKWRLPAGIALAMVYCGLFGYGAYEDFALANDFQVHNYQAIKESLDRYCPNDRRVGAFQAGVVGYFSDREVINLDGVVNPRALAALQHRTMLSYLQEERITCVADDTRILDRLLIAPLRPEERDSLQPLTLGQSRVQVYSVVASSRFDKAHRKP